MTALVAVQYRGLDGALGAESLTALAENPAIRTLFGPPVALDDRRRVHRLADRHRARRPGRYLGGADGHPADPRRGGGRPVGPAAGRTAAPGVPGRPRARRAARCVARRRRRRRARPAAARGTGGRVGAVRCRPRPAPAWSARRSACSPRSCSPTGARPPGWPSRSCSPACWPGWSSDGVPALAWLAWGTPFGLLGRAAPFTADRVLPLLVLAVLVAAVAAAAVALAAGRDVGRGRLAGRDRRARPSRLLGQPAGPRRAPDPPPAGRLGRRRRGVLPAHRPARDVDDRRSCGTTRPSPTSPRRPASPSSGR